MVLFLHGSRAVKPQIASDAVCEISSHVAGPFQSGVSLLPHVVYLRSDLLFHKDGRVYRRLELWLLAYETLTADV